MYYIKIVCLNKIAQLDTILLMGKLLFCNNIGWAHNFDIVHC
jgi:hypothetical protein